MYSLDTSFFMDWQARYYPLDVFQSVESRIERLIAEEQARAVALVDEERARPSRPPIPTFSIRKVPISRRTRTLLLWPA